MENIFDWDKLINKIYPQSLINDNFNEQDSGTSAYVVKMKAPYFSQAKVYCFRSLDNALREIRENYSYYNNLSFEVSKHFTVLDDDDSIIYSTQINYEF